MENTVKIENIFCEFCHREKGKENATNWQRHVDACKAKHEKKNQLKRKNKESQGSIKKFFKTSSACISVIPKGIVNCEFGSTVDDNGTNVGIGDNCVVTVGVEKSNYNEIGTDVKKDHA